MPGKQTRITLFTLLAVTVPLWLSGHAEADESQKFTLELGDYRFKPATVNVVAGRPVELMLVNKDVITPHNLTFEDSGAGLDVAVDVQPGKTATIEFTATAPGRYTFYCDKKLLFGRSHRERGMEGELVVQSAP